MAYYGTPERLCPGCRSNDGEHTFGTTCELSEIKQCFICSQEFYGNLDDPYDELCSKCKKGQRVV
jgi:hypothetical protein